MIQTHCAICKRDNSVEVYPANFNQEHINEHVFSARRLPDTIHYRIVRCKSCGLTYSNPTLSPKKIESLYRKSLLTYEEQITSLNDTYGRYLSDCDQFLLTKDRLLEIGCGNGFFLEKARELGFREVFGVEPSRDSFEKASKSVRKNIITDIFRRNLYSKNYFDIVCIFQTLDHLTDPNSVLSECRGIVKKDGLILAIVHDVSSWSAKILGERSPIFDIEHLYLYNKQTLQQIFINNNFEVLNVFDVVNSHTLGYWTYLLPIATSIKRTSLALIKNLNLDKLSIPILAGNIGIIARKS